MAAQALKMAELDMMVVQCANYSKHGIPTGWWGSREFKLDEDELHYMNALPLSEQKKIWDVHFETGKCVSCLVDERRLGKMDFQPEPMEVRVGSCVALIAPKSSLQKEDTIGLYGEVPVISGISEYDIPEIRRREDEDEASFLERLLEFLVAIKRYLEGCFGRKEGTRAEREEDDF